MEREPADTPTRYAVLVSLLAHAVLVATAGMFVARSSMAEVEPPPAGGEVAADGFSAGDTFDIDGLVDDEPGEQRHDTPAAETAAEPEADDEPAPLAQPTPSKPTLSEPPPKVAAPKAPAPKAASASDPGSSPLSPPPRRPDDRMTAPRDYVETALVRTGRAGGPAAGHSGDHGARTGKGRGGRRYGAEGTTRGVRNLARAFTRAIPAAVSADRAWSRLPIGEAGQIDVVVEVDGQGKIIEVELPDEAPEPMRALVRRTMALLQAGRFALRGRSPEAGREILRIAVVLSQGEPIEREGASPYDAVRLGHDKPSRERPGRAYFDLVSGRHFEATVTILTPRQPDEEEGQEPGGGDEPGQETGPEVGTGGPEAGTGGPEAGTGGPEQGAHRDPPDDVVPPRAGQGGAGGAAPAPGAGSSD